MWLIVGLFNLIYKAVQSEKNKDTSQNSELGEEAYKRMGEDAEWSEESEKTFIHLKVKDMKCAVKSIGMQTPKAIKGFVITFEKDDGEEFDFYVSEEMYEGFEVGQTGVAEFNGEQLYGFVLDEDSSN